MGSLALVACGSTRDEDGPSAARADVRGDPPVAGRRLARTAARTAARSAGSCGSRVARLGGTTFAYAAAARGRVVAYRRPGRGPIERFRRLNVNGVRTVFAVRGAAWCSERWLRVQLPIRPNGMTGWVRARDVVLSRMETSIVVDLSERRVVLRRGGQPLLSATIAFGARDTPTPTGSFYVNQRLVAPDPSGPFGPGGIGISAFSPVLTSWAQGGPIAIHGTNRPDLLGLAISNGCVRVRNDVLRRLWRLSPEGTPVVIRV